MKGLIALGRAFGGSLFLSLPLLMTMEMWSLGFTMSRWRLALLLAALIPLLARLAYQAGFRETFNWLDSLVDGFVALAVGFATSAFFLWLFGVLERGMNPREVIGKVSLQAVPASIGAVLARSQLGGEEVRLRERGAGPLYGSELFLMAAGSLFFAFNVAPTDEMVLIAQKMTPARMLVLAGISLVLMYLLIYALEFRGQAEPPPGTPGWMVILRFTLPGYAVSLGISAWVLWTFGRLEGTGLPGIAAMTIVLGFPASLGAAAARLIL